MDAVLCGDGILGSRVGLRGLRFEFLEFAEKILAAIYFATVSESD